MIPQIAQLVKKGRMAEQGNRIYVRYLAATPVVDINGASVGRVGAEPAERRIETSEQLRQTSLLCQSRTVVSIRLRLLDRRRLLGLV